MSDINPAPQQIASDVNMWAADHRRNVEQFDNSEFLDRDGMFTLHALARSIYAEAWDAGRRYAMEAARGSSA